MKADEEIQKQYKALSDTELLALYRNKSLSKPEALTLKKVMDDRGLSAAKPQESSKKSLKEQEPTNEKGQNEDKNETIQPGSFKQTLTVIAILLLIPALGFFTAFYIFTDININLEQQGQIPANDMCYRLSMLDELGEAIPAEAELWCEQISHIVMLADASVIAAILGLLIPSIYWLAVKFAGHDRKRLARIFPPLTVGSIWLIIFLVLLHGGILTYGVYIGESYIFGVVHFFIVGAIGLGALIGGIALITNVTAIAGKLTTTAIGKKITAQEEPAIFDLIKSIVEKLDSKPPTNVVIGIEPTFYVTSSKVLLNGEKLPLEGETLFISSTLARLLTNNELRAVLGHEFGHFRGEDTLYSMKFAPVFAGLSSSLQALSASAEEGLFTQIARLPAFILLMYLWQQFSLSEAAISRIRELEADKAGVEVSSAQDLANSLMKIGLAVEHWPDAVDVLMDHKQRNEDTSDFGNIFKDGVRESLKQEDQSKILTTIIDNEIAHPTDSHPSLRTRLTAFSIPTDVIPDGLLNFPDNSSADLINNCSAIEEVCAEALSELIVDFEERPEAKAWRSHDKLLELCHRLVAVMFNTADKVAPEGLKTAEGSGERLFEGFNITELHVWIDRHEEWSDVADSISTDSKALSLEDKELLISYLWLVANAFEIQQDIKNDLINRISKRLEPERSIEVDM